MRKIEARQDNNANNETAAQTFGTIMANLTNVKDKNPIIRKKRVDVVAAKSISLSDLIESTNGSGGQPDDVEDDQNGDGMNIEMSDNSSDENNIGTKMHVGSVNDLKEGKLCI